MNVFLVCFALGLALACALDIESRAPLETSIHQYPEVAGVLRSDSSDVYNLHCVGTILNNRSILTSALCVYSEALERLRVRVGSSQPNSDGVVYELSEKIVNPNWDEWAMQSDLAILRTATNIQYGDYVQPGKFAGSNYALNEETLVNTVGWGYLSFPWWYSAVYDQISTINLWTLNISQCRLPYAAQGFGLTDDQICTGLVLYQSTSNRDKCFAEPGAPLFHNGIVVGVRSFGLSCIANETPSINVRVSSFITWITANA